jgi:hypothetical protein
MKLADLRKALRLDVIGSDCSLYEPEGAREISAEPLPKRRARALSEDLRRASFRFATEAERRAHTAKHTELGNLAFQEDNGKLYMLIAIDAKGTGTWQEVVT